jgi:hypothetical protein
MIWNYKIWKKAASDDLKPQPPQPIVIESVFNVPGRTRRLRTPTVRWTIAGRLRIILARGADLTLSALSLGIEI